MQANQPGRNDPCPCGSGKKYKKCCGLNTNGVRPALGEQAPQGKLPAAEIERLGSLYANGKFAELELDAQALLQSHPASGDIWKLLAMAQRRLGKDATATLERAGELLPNDAEVWNTMGNALRDAGNLVKAEQSYRRALQLRPDLAEAHSNLGLTLCDFGRAIEAEAHCRRALALKPDLVIALNNLGLALREQGKLDEALACYRRAAQIQPNLAELHHNIGNILHEYGRLDEAVACYRRATELNPRYLSAYVNMARIWRRQKDRSAEIKALCSKVLEVDPSFGPALMLESELCADVGQFEAGEAVLKRIDPSSTSYPEAWANIPYMRKMKQEDGNWLAVALELAARQLPARRKSLLQFAIGKYFDDIGEFDNAFASYRLAHELAKSFGVPYQRAARKPAVDGLLRAYDRDWIAHRQRGGQASDKPVLVVGMPRSGTSLVEQILASHPAVFGAGELDFWRDESQSLLASGGVVGDAALAESVQRYLRLLGELAPDAMRVVDKMPGNFLYLGLIHAAFPNARIIHMQRDPIDTCLSIYFQRFETPHPYANDLEDMAHAYRAYRYAMAHWEAVLPAHAILHVPYEELVDEQESWTRKLLDFVGLPWDARCLDFHLHGRAVGTASNWQVRQKMNKSSVQRWRHYEKYVGPLLELQDANLSLS